MAITIQKQIHIELENSYYIITNKIDGFAIEIDGENNINAEGLGKGIWLEASRQSGISMTFKACGTLKDYFKNCGDIYLEFPLPKDLKRLIGMILLNSTEVDLCHLLNKIIQTEEVAQNCEATQLSIDKARKKINDLPSIGGICFEEISPFNAASSLKYDSETLKGTIVYAYDKYAQEIAHTARILHKNSIKIVLNLEDEKTSIIFHIDNKDINKLTEYLVSAIFYSYNFSDVCDIIDFIADLLLLRCKNTNTLSEASQCLDELPAAIVEFMVKLT